ncbi:MAG: hypothetical protein V3S11_00865 [Elusimicrobiota bacterium]
MRAFAALLLLAALPVRAEEFKLAERVTLESSVSPNGFLSTLFLLPLAVAFSLPHHGFSRYPYDGDGGYGRGERKAAYSLKTAVQLTRGGRGAQHVEMRVRGAKRLGWDLAGDVYGAGHFHPARRGAIYSGHLNSNYLQTKTALLELGFGAASFQNPAPLWGGSAELNLELFPSRPWSLLFRAQSALIRGQGYHTLSVGAGATWRRLGLAAGCRGFINPIRSVWGPELSFNAWF